jgi:ABC-2 type transport system permease protein
VIMVLLFGYIFGSAISVPGGGDYRAYLMPGLFAMTTITGLIVTGTATTDDMAKGVMDRFRSMPMARTAVPFGQTTADLLIGVVSLTGMVVCGLAVGWRAHNGIGATAAAFGLLLLLRYAVAWAGIALGLTIRKPETMDAMTPLVFPLTMLGNTFVPTSGMPAWLRVIAEWNPVSAAVAACRDLFGNPGAAAGAAWPLQHPVVATIGWSLLLLVVLVPLSTRLYRTSGR